MRNDIANDTQYQNTYDPAKQDVAEGRDTADLIVNSMLMSARTFISYYSPATQAASRGLISRALVPTLVAHDSSDTGDAPLDSQRELLAAAAGKAPPLSYIELNDANKHTATEGHFFAGTGAAVTNKTIDWLAQGF